MCERFHFDDLLIVFCMLCEQGYRGKIVGTIIIIYPSCARGGLAGEEKYLACKQKFSFTDNPHALA